MSHFSDLDIARQNMLTCPLLPSDRPNAVDHIQNVINHLEFFTVEIDTPSMDYIMLQLHLAVHKMEQETTR